MTYFTDSTYERMMTQPPARQEIAPAAPVWPSGHPCHGCPYGKDAPCLGICYRKLLQKKE